VERTPAGSENIRAEVAELIGVGVGAVQPADNPTCQGRVPVRAMSLAGRPSLVAAGSHAATPNRAVAKIGGAPTPGERNDIP
jgi:hypothetical protein